MYRVSPGGRFGVGVSGDALVCSARLGLGGGLGVVWDAVRSAV
jgi:hypothetical protein